MKEYEEKAVALALEPSKLQSLRTRLMEARLTCPLFDTLRWVSFQVFSGLTYSIMQLKQKKYS